jgi:K+-sensing histidine kinase KdpD
LKPFDQISHISPLPIVDLETDFVPQDGWMFALSSTCRRHLIEGSKCYEYYRTLAGDKTVLSLHQCPFGFATMKFISGNSNMAVTGFVPFPRLGGSAEKILSKRHANYKFDVTHVEKMILNLRKSRGNLQKVEEETVENYSMALHEIRKLNRTVVQNAERLCRKESPSEPENASKELVSIWKAAELMSRQFEVIEILANQEHAALPLNTTSDLYRLFDKCVKVFETIGVKRRFSLYAIPNSYSPKVEACDKTIPIIPTVLIENAIKYSIPDSEIRIKLEQMGENCFVNVSNLSANPKPLNDYIFQRGVRATSDKDGSGNGLYVAQLIAHQHNTSIRVQSVPFKAGMKHTFSLNFKTI